MFYGMGTDLVFGVTALVILIFFLIGITARSTHSLRVVRSYTEKDVVLRILLSSLSIDIKHRIVRYMMSSEIDLENLMDTISDFESFPGKMYVSIPLNKDLMEVPDFLKKISWDWDGEEKRIVNTFLSSIRHALQQ